MLSFLSIASTTTVIDRVIFTDSSFKRLVINRPKQQVWMVMFFSSTCPACRNAMPKFEEASSLSGGIARFGFVNIEKCPETAKLFKIKSTPSFRIFHADGDVEYTDKKDAKAFLKGATSYLKDYSQEAEEKWFGDFIGHPSAILFTDDARSKSAWRGISSYFLSKSVRIGVCKNHELAEKFGVEKFPSIYFFNGTNTERFAGKGGFKEIKEAMEKFFEKKLTNKVYDPMAIMVPENFIEECVGGKANCILAAMPSAPKGFIEMQKLYAHHKLKWFVGNQNLPFDVMKKKPAIWIYNPRKNAFVFVEKPENLRIELEHVLDGQAKWKKIEKFNSEEL